MGEVFLAEDLSLDRRVALKLLLAGLPDGRADRRLLREAKAAAHLDHPFICKVYEIGEHEGRSFLATEYVDGVTLKERLAAGRLPQEDARRIAAEVAEALHFAHSRGIVHRDVKPANVMLGADGHVKVMDFGIAKRLDATLGADAKTMGAASASVPGELTGTLAYMSPEQLRGEPVDQRSDAFSFGVMLHELLTGRHPFTRASIFETANAILTEPAPPLDQAVRDASPLLAHVVARCLEKDRDRRYQSLSDVRIELENPSASVPAQPAARSRRWSRWIMAPAMLAGLLVLVGIVNWVRPLPFFATEPALAFKERDWIIVSDFNNLTGDALFDRSLRVALEVAIAQSHYVNVYPPDRVAATLTRMGRSPAARLDETLAAEVAERENVRGLLACDIAQLGNTYSLTARLIRPQTRVVVGTESVTAPDKDGILGALDQLARRVRGNLGESLAALSDQSKPLPKVTTSSLEALKLYSDSIAGVGTSERNPTDQLLREALKLDPQFALAHAELGRRYYLAPSHEAREEGEKHFKEALATSDRLTLRERLWIQAVAEDSRGNRDRAVQAYETYLAQYPDDVRALFRVSWTQMAALGEWDRAIEGFKRVVTLEPNGVSGWVNLASAYSGKRDFQNAVPSYRKAFALSPSLVLGMYVNHEYGFTLVQIGKTAEAEAVFDRMTKEADPPSLRAKGFRSFALLDMYRGRYTAAVGQLRHAIAIDQTYSQGVSEFRDRLYLVTALNALGRSRESGAEWVELDRCIAKLALSPDWLARPVMMKARGGDIAGAKRLLQSMLRTTGKATADSGVARNMDLDRAWVDLAKAELDVAEGRSQQAIQLLEPAHVVLKSAESLEALANAYAAAGRHAEAVSRYEEVVRTPRLGNETQEIWQLSHVALARLYERLNRPDDAKQLYTAVADRWKDGDNELVLLKTSRDQLARLSPGAEN